jgi:hypothetical protein
MAQMPFLFREAPRSPTARKSYITVDMSEELPQILSSQKTRKSHITVDMSAFSPLEARKSHITVDMSEESPLVFSPEPSVLSSPINPGDKESEVDCFEDEEEQSHQQNDCIEVMISTRKRPLSHGSAKETEKCHGKTVLAALPTKRSRITAAEGKKDYSQKGNSRQVEYTSRKKNTQPLPRTTA